jgi:transcriptional regulator with XRE-family HTH domain
MTEINKHIAQTLKTLRKERGWSLDKTALQTGVSKAMLGQIEREESSPTIATLWKIATGFNTPFSAFLCEEIEKPEILHPSDTKIKVLPLFPYDDALHLEVFLIELLPGCEHLSPPHKPGVIEHVLVASGKMEVLVDGIWKPLSKGEGIRFDASKPHGYRNLSQNLAVIHDIIHYGGV